MLSCPNRYKTPSSSPLTTPARVSPLTCQAPNARPPVALCPCAAICFAPAARHDLPVGPPPLPRRSRGGGGRRPPPPRRRPKPRLHRHRRRRHDHLLPLHAARGQPRRACQALLDDQPDGARGGLYEPVDRLGGVWPSRRPGGPRPRRRRLLDGRGVCRRGRGRL